MKLRNWHQRQLALLVQARQRRVARTSLLIRQPGGAGAELVHPVQEPPGADHALLSLRVSDIEVIQFSMTAPGLVQMVGMATESMNANLANVLADIGAL